jgi:hypothetical protein
VPLFRLWLGGICFQKGGNGVTRSMFIPRRDSGAGIFSGDHFTPMVGFPLFYSSESGLFNGLRR